MLSLREESPAKLRLTAPRLKFDAHALPIKCHHPGALQLYLPPSTVPLQSAVNSPPFAPKIVPGLLELINFYESCWKK